MVASLPEIVRYGICPCPREPGGPTTTLSREIAMANDRQRSRSATGTNQPNWTDRLAVVLSGANIDAATLTRVMTREL